MINLGGDMGTMKIEGEEYLADYRAQVERKGRVAQSKHRRFFCQRCGCHLYAWHESWPDLVHPVASAIDTPLPEPPARVHLMLGSKANWVPAEAGPEDEQYEEYPRKSLADWHAEHGYTDPSP
jgi:hypothetical protein